MDIGFGSPVLGVLVVVVFAVIAGNVMRGRPPFTMKFPWSK